MKTDKMESADWLSMYYCDFRRRLIKLLAKSFQSFTTGLALSLLDNKSVAIKNERKSPESNKPHSQASTVSVKEI